jgi:hypothetical protein
MVPWTTEPFLSSMVTVSLESFMRKRTSFIVKTLSKRYGKKVLLKRTDERPVPCLPLRTTASKTILYPASWRTHCVQSTDQLLIKVSF